VDQADSTARSTGTAPDGLIDKWYHALDQRQLTIGKRPWPALVSGIHAHGANLWIQISHADNPEESLVLRVSRDTSIDAAIATAQAWSAFQPDPRAIDLTKTP